MAGGKRMPSNRSTTNGLALSRRGLLAGGAASLLTSLAATACSGDSKSAHSPSTTPTTASIATTSSSEGAPSADAATAALSASIEVLAVNIYQAALASANANRLGTVPAATRAFAAAAMAHHEAALARWNSVVTAAGAQAIDQPPATLKAQFDRIFARMTDATALARLALQLEHTAADTYLSVIPTLQSAQNITLAAQLQVVDQEHAAILHYLIGGYPVPDSFQNTNSAFTG